MYQIYVVRVLNDKNTIQMYDLILYITIKFCFIKKIKLIFSLNRRFLSTFAKQRKCLFL